MKYLKAVSESVIFIWALFFAGFVIGVIFTFFDKSIFFQEDILNPEFVFRLQNAEIDKRALFFLCLGKRLRAFFLVFLLSYSMLNLVVTGGFFLLTGLATGCLMELLSIRYGAAGLLMYLELVFPHGIFYALGFSLLGQWCIRQKDYRQKEEGTARRKQPLGRVYLALSVVITGVILESYVNLKIFL